MTTRKYAARLHNYDADFVAAYNRRYLGIRLPDTVREFFRFRYNQYRQAETKKEVKRTSLMILGLIQSEAVERCLKYMQRNVPKAILNSDAYKEKLSTDAGVLNAGYAFGALDWWTKKRYATKSNEQKKREKAYENTTY